MPEIPPGAWHRGVGYGRSIYAWKVKVSNFRLSLTSFYNIFKFTFIMTTSPNKSIVIILEKGLQKYSIYHNKHAVNVLLTYLLKRLRFHFHTGVKVNKLLIFLVLIGQFLRKKIYIYITIT